MMRTASIAWDDRELAACEQDDWWTVRLAHLEIRARYLDLALAELLGNAPEAHRAAARLLADLAQVVEQQDAASPLNAPAPAPVRERRHVQRRRLWTKPLVLGTRAVVVAVATGTAFMLTTWLNALK